MDYSAGSNQLFCELFLKKVSLGYTQLASDMGHRIALV